MSTSFPPIIHMFSTGRFRCAFCVGLLLLAPPSLLRSYPPSPAGFGGTGGEATLLAQAVVQADGTLYRVFLRDGSTLLSYGEFARVADKIVVSVPLGSTPAGPELHLLSIP